MNKKIWILSIVAAVLMILLPLSSVVGVNVVKTNEKNKASSPLFVVRQQSKNKISSEYLGKEKFLNLFFENKLNYANSIDRAIKFFKSNPVLFNTLLEKISKHPIIVEVLNENNIDQIDFDSYTNSIKNNPILLEQEIKMIEKYIPGNTPLTTGLNTTNPIAIIILIIAILPVILLIGVLVATITIITCLNIGGCFETVMENMLDSFIQGLKEPDD